MNNFIAFSFQSQRVEQPKKSICRASQANNDIFDEYIYGSHFAEHKSLIYFYIFDSTPGDGERPKAIASPEFFRMDACFTKRRAEEDKIVKEKKPKKPQNPDGGATAATRTSKGDPQAHVSD